MKNNISNQYTGTLFIISAPSGAGKSSLIRAYLEQKNQYPAKVSISHTTRAPRPGEEHGEDYYFVDHDHFESLISQQAFVEYANVFDHYYGTSKAEIEQSLLQGVNVFLDIDWQGAQQVREKMPQSKSIFILPPSLAELEHRLIKRGQDTEQVIRKRMAKAQAEISHYHEYDYVIINDDFNTSLNALNSIIIAASLERDKQEVIHQSFFTKLLTHNNY
ncbi:MULTISPECIES: guanylate kinase [unclassified Gilliamella]|uniref:guanylate kinase n=2 Tax=unclassified Gilliamella TaxID=2685620 RepID=UPI00226A1C1F|nr:MULTISPECIES: guanylate kinase [unclassified Gilliamella]MCX8573392.1 guanylate kinase [Gilliamella sp. B3831]MCX8575980.1 guanylate kinase [Gilliamella sp. B3815]MCX8579070.1 guanylate kinase [Gilliamella sp. B2717]MCX8588194.1 guanylate kinase [Gilliamella sp. B3801]MCX8589488.1 guanylate kinase [Gilliamella sp. B3812]